MGESSSKTSSVVVSADASVSAPLTVLPATGCEKAAWIFMGAGLLFVLHFGMLPALLSGLLVYALVHVIAKRLSGKSLSHGRAKLVAIGLIAVVMIGVTVGIVLALIAFLNGRLGGGLPALFEKMAAILESAGARIGWTDFHPAAEELKEKAVHALREHAQELQHIGGEVGHVLLHALIGMIIGAMATLETRVPVRPLASALTERVRRLADAFEKIVFAQVKISGLNTAVTALFLLVALPLCGVELPLRKTLVVITFIVGMLPVIGNLISNTAIVVIALGFSLPAAIACLVFLIVIHKLEYFLNAKIVGSQIHAAAWEILLAMLCFEVAFGLPGVIIAPIAYAYLKQELTDRALI
jgi:predicted PurR-regulated permease PerM